jgi:hypothetical protein
MWYFQLDFRVRDLKTSANRPRIRTSTSSPISTLMKSVSLKTQNMKVVDIFLGVLYHLESLQSDGARIRELCPNYEAMLKLSKIAQLALFCI